MNGLTLGRLRDVFSTFSQPYGDTGHMTFDHRSMPNQGGRPPEVLVSVQVTVRYRVVR